MTKSLQDQLLSLGVADKKKAKQATHKKRVESKKAPKGPSVQESLEQTQQAARDAKRERDQALAKARDAKRGQAEKLAQIRDMVKAHALSRGAEAERVDYRFPYGKKIRPMPVVASVRDQLARGQLGLIEVDGAIHIVPRETLERCLERMDGHAIFSYIAEAESDDYGDYPPIPDDLDW
jgi:uncharacterized protein YaiL (DUF2058 family)